MESRLIVGAQLELGNKFRSNLPDRFRNLPKMGQYLDPSQIQIKRVTSSPQPSTNFGLSRKRYSLTWFSSQKMTGRGDFVAQWSYVARYVLQCPTHTTRLSASIFEVKMAVGFAIFVGEPISRVLSDAIYSLGVRTWINNSQWSILKSSRRKDDISFHRFVFIIRSY